MLTSPMNFISIYLRLNARFASFIPLLLTGAVLNGTSASFAAESDISPGPIRVFILAGQSNTEGKAKLSLLEHQIRAPETKDLFNHLHRDGQWIEREDVWIKFLDRKGKLTVGFGSPGCIGPELQFGHAAGDHYGEQVLLIKTAWGGRSLYKDFRPPSAGLPPADHLGSELEQARKDDPGITLPNIQDRYGASYRAMLEEVSNTLDQLPLLFPDYDSRQGCRIAGFIWFQGWNDMIDDQYTAAYAENLAHFIRDIRKDLHVPDLPVVVAQMGVDGVDRPGLEPNPKMRAFKGAQASVGRLPEFQGNVVVIPTDVHWDMTADAVFRKGWREHIDEWNRVGSDFPYHYLGSAKTYSAIGQAMAEAAIKLDAQRSNR
jgi:alpha-galactosidase